MIGVVVQLWTVDDLGAVDVGQAEVEYYGVRRLAGDGGEAVRAIVAVLTS